jgi:hypothetical protein
VLTALIGVAATLLGSFTTYLFQSRTAARAELFARGERMREEQLGACSAFAAGLTALKRGVVTLWFRGKENPSGPDYRASLAETDRLGAEAEAARIRVQLLFDDPQLMEFADRAFGAIAAVRDAADRNALREAEIAFDTAVKAFVTAAAARLRPAIR